MAITVMEVLKRLPRTNCGDCGQATCLAFATRVIKEGEDLGKCPQLSAGDEFSQLIRSQQQAGVGRRRESVAISLEVLQEKVAPLDFAALAAGLAAEYGEEAGRPYLA
ncbi:MAG: Fe-S cluster protein, partial [Deltaproteobacteria bacterium]|nr:Fe-S cluster protein [Deltaproteobacteria bacterium]